LDAVPKLRAHPSNLAAFLAGRDEEIVPVNLELWPSLLCNASCADCPYIVNNARDEADRQRDDNRRIGLPMTAADCRPFLMPLELFAKIAAEFKQAGGLSVTLTGGGEPTMHPQLADFGHIARRNGLFWGLYSNGYELKPDLIDRLLENSPEFIRVSVNSWSAESHHGVYRLGLEAYDQIRKNVAYLARHAPPTTTVGIGYVVRHLLPQHVQGMGEFIDSVVRPAGRLDYAAVRPAVIYYREDGRPREAQPHHRQFSATPELCRQGLGRFCNDLGVALQINDRGFQIIAEGHRPGLGLATSWASSATHTGELYLLSEANGSTQPTLAQLRYGDLRTASFRDAWFGERRLRLARDFAAGKRLAPVLHKLSGLDEALKGLRQLVGILEPVVARAVAELEANTTKSPHWMFI